MITRLLEPCNSVIVIVTGLGDLESQCGLIVESRRRVSRRVRGVNGERRSFFVTFVAFRGAIGPRPSGLRGCKPENPNVPPPSGNRNLCNVCIFKEQPGHLFSFLLGHRSTTITKVNSSIDQWQF